MSEKIETLFEKMDKRLEKQEEIMLQLVNMVGKTNERIDLLQKDITEIKKTVQNIEQSEPKDITAMLQQINSKIDQKEQSLTVDYTVISDKVSDLEADLKLIKRVITNH